MSRSGRISACAWWLNSPSASIRPAEECAERHRDAEQRADPRRADAGDQHRQRERFAAAALRHQPEQHRQHEPADGGNGANRQRRLQQHQRDAAQRGPARENRYEQQQPDDREVLKQQHADHQPAVRRVELVAGRQFAQHDGRARQRDEQADEERDAPRFAHRQDHAPASAPPRCRRSAACRRTARPSRCGRISLSENSRPTVKSSSTMPRSARTLTSSCVLTMPMPVGPAIDAGDDERDDRRDSQPRQHEDQAERDRVGRNQFGEKCSVLRHAPVVYAAAARVSTGPVWAMIGALSLRPATYGIVNVANLDILRRRRPGTDAAGLFHVT